MKAHVVLKITFDRFYNDIEGKNYDEIIGKAKGLFESWLSLNHDKYRNAKVEQAIIINDGKEISGRSSERRK